MLRSGVRAFSIFGVVALFVALSPPAAPAQTLSDLPVAGTIDVTKLREALEAYKTTGGATGRPSTSLADSEEIAGAFEQIEGMGGDLDLALDLVRKAEPEGTIDIQSFNAMDYVDPREMHEALVERMRREGFSEKVIEALNRGEVDKSVRDWLIEQGADPEYVEAFVRKDPAMEEWIIEQAHRYGVPAIQYETMTESDLRMSLPDHMYSAGKSAKEVEALRAVE